MHPPSPSDPWLSSFAPGTKSSRQGIQTRMKQTAQRVFSETLAAIDIPAAMEKALARSGTRIHAGEVAIDLRDFRQIVAVLGQGCFTIARGLAGILTPDFAPEGILVVPAAPQRSLHGWETFVAGHPVPNEESFAAGRAILDRLARCDERTLIFFLISGGGSSLVEQPLDPALDARRFSEAAFRAGDLRRVHRRNQRDPQASVRHQGRTPGRSGAALDEINVCHQRCAARRRIRAGVRPDAARSVDDS